MSNDDAFGRAQRNQGWRGIGPPPAVAKAQESLTVQFSRTVDSFLDDLSYVFKSDSVVLGRNLQDAGYERWDNQHAHHIVAAGDPRAAARAVLNNAGMDINSAFNGLFLDSSQHARSHTNIYYDTVNRGLAGASSYAEVATRLTGMRLY